MITKNDCLLLLYNIKSESNIDTSAYEKQVFKADIPPVEVIKFINDNRQLDLTNFYTKIRKSYNNKKSKLYINIMKSDETDLAETTLTTLTGLLTQVCLYANSLNEDREMFLRHARCTEITKVLYNYFKTYDISSCKTLLQLIKADIKVLESIN